ncbi:MAG TPA: hypothetical protein VK551_01720 [Thermodesulfobacteriota bacterium]|nr:hypothetical protein [Thermodesulfobacteriota bacterium]
MFACAHVSIKFVRDPSFSNPMNRLFIILNHGQIDNTDSSYTPYLINALKDEFSKEGVEITIRVVKALALNDSIYKSEIVSYEPDGVMALTATGGTVTSYGSVMEIVYDVSLFDLSSKKRIWRAQIKASGGALVREKRMKLMARDLVKQLREQKIIGSEPRSKGKEL